MKTKGWKITALIAIGLLMLSWALMFWAVSIGTEYLEKDSECSINICSGEMYDYYFYDEVSNICNCYTGDDITYQEYMS